MKRRYIFICLLVLTILILPDIFGQPGAPPPPPDGGGDGPVVGGSEEVPLDGGVLWMLLAGAALFYKKAFGMFKKSDEN